MISAIINRVVSRAHTPAGEEWVAGLRVAGDLLLVAGSLLAMILLIRFLRKRRDLTRRSPFIFSFLFFLFLSCQAAFDLEYHTSFGDAALLPSVLRFAAGLFFVTASLFMDSVLSWSLRIQHPDRMEETIRKREEEIRELNEHCLDYRKAERELEERLNRQEKEAEALRCDFENQLEKKDIQLKRGAERLEHELDEKRAALADADQKVSRAEELRRLAGEKLTRLWEKETSFYLILSAEGSILEVSPSVSDCLGYPPEKICGEMFQAWVHPDDRMRSARALRAGLEKQEGFREVELRIRDISGKWRQIAMVAQNRIADEAVGGILINASDRTLQRHMEDEVKDLALTMKEIGGSMDFFSALDTALKRICSLTGWTYGEAWICREDGKVLECSPAWAGPERLLPFREASRQLRFLPGMGLPGRVWASGRSEWIPDVAGAGESILTRAAMLGDAGFRAALGVPIISGDELLAVLVFFLETPQRKDRFRIDLVTLLASFLGAVLQRKVAEEDRTRAYTEIEKRIQERAGELIGENENLRRDIEQGLRRVEELKASEKNYETLVHSAGGILWEYDLHESRYTFVSQQAEQILGYPVEHWFSEAAFWQDHIHGDDRDRAFLMRQRAVENRTGDPCEYRMVTAEGRNLWFRDMVQVVLDGENPVKLRGMMVDITERKMAEMAWKQEQDFVSAVLDTASAIVLIMDEEGNIIRVNRSCQSLSGYPEEEIVGKCFWDIFLVPEEVDRVKNIFLRLLAGQFPANFESHWVSREGATLVVAWSNTMLRAGDNGRRHIIATGVDVTKRKEAENQLQEAVRDLARSNLELDRYSEELKEANERLRKLDELKSHFISAASHELKTPLTSLKGYVEMVLNGEAGPVNGEQKEYLGYVKTSTDRLHRLLRELLDISKIESGQARLKRRETDLRQLILEEIAVFRAQAQEKKIQVRVETDPHLRKVHCDSDMVREVLDNLISNAIKYTPSGGNVRVFARNTDEGTDFGVRDSGIGIRDEDQIRIFEPFQSIEKSGFAGSEESTGLGLTLVKRIVEAHGGHIRVQSEEGKGTEFLITLPPEGPVHRAGSDVLQAELAGKRK